MITNVDDEGPCVNRHLYQLALIKTHEPIHEDR